MRVLTNRELFLVAMDTRGGGIYTPSYSHVVANRIKEEDLNCFKKPMEEEIERINTKKWENISSHEQEENHEEFRGEKIREGNS